MSEEFADAEIEKRFEAALQKALEGSEKISVGTLNEKPVHAVLKNFYANFCDEHEIKIGNYYADAVTENGIFEIQTRHLYLLKKKLETFLPSAKVNVVHPFYAEQKTIFINEKTGEIFKETNYRKKNSLLSVFREIYSIRDFLKDENLKIIIAKLRVEKRVYFDGETLPDLSKRKEKKRCKIVKIPQKFLGETVFENENDYKNLLPENLPKVFTKAEFCRLSGEAKSSLRLEVARAAGVIEKVGKEKNSFLYSVKGAEKF